MERIDEYPIINVKMWSKRYGGSVEVDIDPRKKFTCKDLETEIKFFNDVKNIKSKYTNQVANNENKNKIEWELKNLTRNYVNSGLIYKKMNV
jgi:hypothetical protein